MTEQVKRPLEGVVVKLLFHQQTDRGMRLADFQSRCVRRGDLHELVTTDHGEADSGSLIDRVGFIGFIEATNGGVIDQGDAVWIGDTRIGTVLGFDECHFPNHYNILVSTGRLLTAVDLSVCVEQVVRFEESPALNAFDSYRSIQ